jgi:hypothetical protein
LYLGLKLHPLATLQSTVGSTLLFANFFSLTKIDLFWKKKFFVGGKFMHGVQAKLCIRRKNNKATLSGFEVDAERFPFRDSNQSSLFGAPILGLHYPF